APDALEVADRPAELPPRGRIRERLLVRPLRQAEGHRGRAESLAVVRRHQLLEAVAGADEEVVPGHVAALEVQLALGDPPQPHHEFASADAKPGRVTLNEDHADALRACALAETSVDEIEP